MKRILNMKTSILMIMIALFMMPVLAQPPGGGQGRGQGEGRGQWTEEDIKQRVDNLSETLECTDQQKEKILEFEIEWSRKMQTEREKMAGSRGDFDREAFRARMQEQRKLRDEKYKEILTDSQMVKYNQLMEERRQQRQQRPGEGDGQDTQRQRGRGGN